jgi:acyl dehydratase
VDAPSPGSPTSTATGMAPAGTTVTFARTVTESDVYLFAGITGDIGPNHTNAQYMAGTRYGQRVAHGALTLGLMSTCSTRLIEMLGDTPTVNYGYDKVRFILRRHRDGHLHRRGGGRTKTPDARQGHGR